MKMLRLLPAALLLAACSSLPQNNADVAAVIQASGLNNQLEWLEAPLQTQKMEGPLALIPDEWIALVNNTIASNIKPEQIRRNLQDRLQQDLSPAELHAVQAFYESPTGQRVVNAESGKTTDNRYTASNSTLDALAEATGAGQAVSLLAQHGLNDAIDVAVKQGCFGLSDIPMAGLVVGVVKKAQLNALRNSVNAGVRQQYASLSEREQSDYLAFAHSSAGRKFLSARASVMNDTASRAGSALNGQLGERIRDICVTK